MIRSSFVLSAVLVLAQGAAATALAKPAPAPAKAVTASPKKAPVRAAPSKAVGAPVKKAASAAAASPVKKPVVVGTVASQKKGKSCFARPVQLVRVRGEQVEPRELSLTLCNGTANAASLDALSVLARPRDVDKPATTEIRAYGARPLPKGKVKAKSKVKYRDPLFVTERVMRVHPGLLVRLQKIANHYPGKIIEIVSGYRPDARDTSRHHHGRALDLRVAGVPREQLRDYLRTFDETGVGYYPNSYFVHMDVRDAKGYWVDRSGPGEPADYGPWPASKDEADRVHDALLKSALADLSAFGAPLAMGGNPSTRSDTAGSAIKSASRSDATRPAPKGLRVKEPEQERDDMSEEEVSRVRQEARKALEEL